MSWILPSFEKLQCPPEYQAHVTAIGGLNRFGFSNFRLVWGQTETEFVWGVDANGKKGQHIVFKHGGIPAWFMESWKPPECFGTPELWYAMSWDGETHTLGEYPWRGLYVPCPFNLYTKKIVGGGTRYGVPDAHGHCQIIEDPVRMEVDAMPLAFWVLDLLIPNMMKEIDTTTEQRRVAMANRKAAELAAFRARAMEAYIDATPAFGGNDFSGASNRQAWMQRIKEKQAGLKLSAEDVRKILGKGHKVH